MMYCRVKEMVYSECSRFALLARARLAAAQPPTTLCVLCMCDYFYRGCWALCSRFALLARAWLAAAQGNSVNIFYIKTSGHGARRGPIHCRWSRGHLGL